MKGYVISDLHLFTKRSYAEDFFNSFKNDLNQADFLVMNGDMFDFAWTTFRTIEETIDASCQWIADLLKAYPSCHFYYIFGNHDSLEPFVQKLRALEKASKNLSLHDTHVLLNNHLFTHGDLPLLKKNPCHRTIPKTIRKKGLFLNWLYALIVKCRVHKIVYSFFSPMYCANIFAKAFEACPQNMTKDHWHVYFGHTHFPFENFQYKNYYFHNTGAAIHHIVCKRIEVHIHD